MEANARRLEFSLASVPEAGINARAALLPFSEVLSAEAFSDLKLIVTELVGNSVAHGPGGQIEVLVELHTDGSIDGAVADEGQGIARSEVHTEPGKGLGLLIVGALAERWGARPGKSEVWFHLEAQELPSRRELDRRVQGLQDQGGRIVGRADDTNTARGASRKQRGSLQSSE
jgi:signal transduction histidine kinase